MAIPAVVAGLIANAPQIVAGAGAIGSVAGAVDKVNKAIQSTKKTIDGFAPQQEGTDYNYSGVRVRNLPYATVLKPNEQQHNNQGVNFMGLF